MRDIAFRYKVKDKNELIYDKDEDFGYLQQQRKLFHYHTNIMSVEYEMQYIERKDVNGKDIYDGDVLKHHGQVIWNNEEYRWSCIDLNWNDKREIHDLDYLTSPFEVIGNIHENPELIAVK